MADLFLMQTRRTAHDAWQLRRNICTLRPLDVAETAGKLGVSKDWLYSRTDTLPFVVRLGRKVRFSDQGIERLVPAFSRQVALQLSYREINECWKRELPLERMVNKKQVCVKYACSGQKRPQSAPSRSR